MKLSRRFFLGQAAAVSAGFASLQTLLAPGSARAATGSVAPVSAQDPTALLGDLLPDPHRIFDLPKGFTFRVISRMGDKMSDNLLVPGLPDGMAAFPGPEGKTIIVCNHELSADDTRRGPTAGADGLRETFAAIKAYDTRDGVPCPGGTTTMLYNQKTGVMEKQFLSLAGTLRNCAGGPTPWGSWVTCEETVVRAGDAGLKQDHGYNFEVPATLDGPADPIALKAMGRFNHEAIAVDPNSGVVYQTEDAHEGLIYRFIPNVPGELHRGGRLQAMVIIDEASADTRNWAVADHYKIGERYKVRWIDMDDVEAPENDLRLRGFAAGAARFARGEGMWYGNGEVYWACTNGGIKKKGQIWRYTPSPAEATAGEVDQPGEVELFVEPNDGAIVDNADNLCVAPWGDVVLAEDGAGPDQFILGVTQKGQVYRIGRNAFSRSELAGVCFSPDGSTLFVNIQHDGITLAITGPWPGRA